MEETFPTLLSCKPIKAEFKKLNEISITTEELTIGRSLDNKLIIPVLDISRNHCKLIKNDKHWILEDYSSFGVHVNGVKLGKGNRKVINHQDIIALDSQKEFVYEFLNEDADLKPSSSKRIKLEPEVKCQNFKCINIKSEESEKYESKHVEDLSKESLLKQDLLNKLEAKMKEQEEIRLKEKQEFELLLQKETEQLRLAKEKELNELAEQKKQRELELMEELKNIKKNLEVQEKQKLEVQQQFNNQLEEMKKMKDEDKVKLEHLMQERLNEAQQNAQKFIEDLKTRVTEREIELATLATERIQKQAEQSGEVISSLQDQLERVRNRLQSVETEKEELLKTTTLETRIENLSNNTLTEFGQIMESELQCSICAELFVSAITLNCSHTFCKYCINMWQKKKKDCPICRAPITSQCKSLVLDSFIDKMVQNLTEEMKQKRKDMLQSREELETELKQSRQDRTSRRSSSYERDSGSSSEFLEEEEEYEEYERYEGLEGLEEEYGWSEEYDEDDLTNFGSDSDSGSDIATDSTGTNGVSNNAAGVSAGTSNNSRGGRRDRVPGQPGAYYGGYGRCFRCGARGHWAPGCPLRNDIPH